MQVLYHLMHVWWCVFLREKQCVKLWGKLAATSSEQKGFCDRGRGLINDWLFAAWQRLMAQPRRQAS